MWLDKNHNSKQKEEKGFKFYPETALLLGSAGPACYVAAYSKELGPVKSALGLGLSMISLAVSNDYDQKRNPKIEPIITIYTGKNLEKFMKRKRLV